MQTQLEQHLSEAERRGAMKLAPSIVRLVAGLGERRGDKPYGISIYQWAWAARERGIAWVPGGGTL